MRTVVLTIGAVILIGILAAIAYSYSGAFNVAAMEKDPALLHWFLKTTREHSIETRAMDVDVPDLGGPEQIDNGFRSYREMCAVCHTPPGGKDSPVNKGLNPPPPDLAKAAKHASDAELFWVTKHGIRMTGMPAWGETHGDKELWDLIAFVKTLPDMSGDDYRAMDTRLPPGHGHGEGGHGEARHDDISGGHDTMDNAMDKAMPHDNSDGHHASDDQPATDKASGPDNHHHDESGHNDGHTH